MGASPADIDILPMRLVLVDALVFCYSLRNHCIAVNVINIHQGSNAIYIYVNTMFPVTSEVKTETLNFILNLQTGG